MKNERLYLTAVAIDMGIVQVIMPDGQTGLFAQRGIRKLTPDEATTAIERGLINPSAFGMRELPSNISISFERPDIQGRAIASFNKMVLYK